MQFLNAVSRCAQPMPSVTYNPIYIRIISSVLLVFKNYFFCLVLAIDTKMFMSFYLLLFSITGCQHFCSHCYHYVLVDILRMVGLNLPP